MKALPVPTVRVVVLNWNSAWFTRRCLRSLLATDYPVEQLEVVLVDNASSDGSADQLQREFPGVRLVRNEANLGFAEGCNRAMQDRRGVDYVALVNNDAEVEPGWLRPLVDALESDAAAGAAAARLVLEPGFVPVEVEADGEAVLVDVTVDGLDVTGRVQLAGFRGEAALDWPLDVTWRLSGSGRMLVPAGPGASEIAVRLDGRGTVRLSTSAATVAGPAADNALRLVPGGDRVQLLNALGTGLNELGEGFDRGFGRPVAELPDDGPVDGFCGGGVLLRSAMLDDVGLFDPGYFAYYEDTDLSWRARRRGWAITAVGDAVIHHAFGGTAGSRSSGFVFLDRRNWILTSIRNATPGLRRKVLGHARTQSVRAFRANVFGRLRRGWRPRLRLTATWVRIWLGVLSSLPRVVRPGSAPVGSAPVRRVRSLFQPAPRPRPPAHRPGGPRIVYVDVTDTLSSGWHAGIQRVVTGLVAALPPADPRLEVVPVVWSAPHRRFRRATAGEWRRLMEPAPRPGTRAPADRGDAEVAPDRIRRAVGRLLRAMRLREAARELQRLTALARTTPDQRAMLLGDLEPGSVLFEVDAVWNRLEPDRVELIPALRSRGVAVVPFVHDLLPVEHPEWFVDPLVEAFRRTVGAQIHGADLVLVASAATEHSVLELCRSEGWPAPAVARLPLGADVPTIGGPGAAPGLPAAIHGRRYALAVGTVEPRKNQRCLLDAFELLEARGGRDDLALVVVGRAGWRAGEVADRLRSGPAERAGVIWLEHVDDAELAALYDGARVVLAPSSAEGFGLTAVEAVRAGVPVIASPGGAPGLDPERVARTLDPEDTEGWAAAIREIALDDEARARAVETLAGYRPPTWEDSARAVAEHLVDRYGTP